MTKIFKIIGQKAEAFPDFDEAVCLQFLMMDSGRPRTQVMALVQVYVSVLVFCELNLSRNVVLQSILFYWKPKNLFISDPSTNNDAIDKKEFWSD